MPEETTTPQETGVLALDERKRILANYIAGQVTRGMRIESQTDESAVLVKGAPVNHLLHLFLSIVTLGIWLVVWIALLIIGGEKRFAVRVDNYGNILQ